MSKRSGFGFVVSVGAVFLTSSCAPLPALADAPISPLISPIDTPTPPAAVALPPGWPTEWPPPTATFAPVPRTAHGSLPEEVIAMYMQQFGVSAEVAQRNLYLQVQAGPLTDEIIRTEPSYAGSWVQHVPEFAFVFAFASPDAQSIMAKHLADFEFAGLVKVVEAPYTMHELLAQLETLSDFMRNWEHGEEFVYGSGLNIFESKLNLYTPDPDQLRQLLANSAAFAETGLLLEDIDFELQTSRAVPAVQSAP